MKNEFGEVKSLVPRAPQHVSDELGLEPARTQARGEGRWSAADTNPAPRGIHTPPA